MLMLVPYLSQVDHDPYAFVEFAEPKHAQEALKAMNERNVLGQVGAVLHNLFNSLMINSYYVNLLSS